MDSTHLMDLPDPVIEHLLTLAIRLATSPPLLDKLLAGDTATDDTLVPYLNTLPRSCIPQVSLAIIMQCPWIDANVASLTGNLWLLDTLAHKLSKAPYNRPMQYDDELLLDKVSEKGFVDVLDWWQNSDYVIGQTNPIQRACDGGHPEVLSWWWSHAHRGRLGERFPDCWQDSFSLMEATRKGDMATLQWWFDNVFEEDMQIRDSCNAGAHRRKAVHMANPFQALIMAAGMRGLKEVVDFWIRVAKGHCGVDASVMRALFACGRMEWIDEHLLGFVESEDGVDLLDGDKATHFATHPISHSALSGNTEFIEHCLGRFSLSPEDCEAVKFDMTLFVTCIGHVHVLDWMHSKGMVDSKVLKHEAFNDPRHEGGFLALLSKFKSTIEHPSKLPHLPKTLVTWLAYFGDLAVLQWWHRHYPDHLQHTMMDHSKTVPALCLKLAIDQGHADMVHFLLAHWRSALSISQVNTCLTDAAVYGHLAVFQAFAQEWELEHQGPLHETLNEFLPRVIRHGHIDIVEWWVSTLQICDEAKYTAILGEILLEYLQAGVPPNVVDWCLKNSRKFGWQGVIQYNLYPLFSTTKLSTKDTLRLISFNGRQSGQAIFEPMVSWTSRLLDAWRGQSLALQLLVTMGLGLLSKRFDLDAAIDAGAGIAVYDWMLRFRKQGRCKWSVANGYRALVDRNKWSELTWWEKKGLPVPPYKPKEDPWDRDELDFDAPLELVGEGFDHLLARSPV